MTIFVSRLSFDTDSLTLREEFETYGDVSSAKVIMDPTTGRSRGFGFVEMPNDDEAFSAIESLNRSELDGRIVDVKRVLSSDQ